MKPTNQAERSTAFSKFMGVYTAAIAIPVVAAYLLAHTPNTAMVAENNRLRAVVDEQQQLLARLSSMEKQLTAIQVADQSYLNETNEVARAGLLKQIEEGENQVKMLLYEARKDSLSFTGTASRKVLASMTNALDALLTYRNLIASLRQTVQQKGSCCGDVEKLTADLKAAQNKIDLLTLVKESNKPASNPGGGGGDSRKDDEIARLNEQLKGQATEIAGYKNQLAQKCPDAPPVSNPNAAAMENLQTQLIYERAECLLEKGNLTRQMSDRRKLYEQALKQFEQVQKTATQEEFRARSNRRIDEIRKKIADW